MAASIQKSFNRYPERRTRGHQTGSTRTFSSRRSRFSQGSCRNLLRSDRAARHVGGRPLSSDRVSTELFERYQRSEKALVAALAEMYVQGACPPARSRRSPGAVRPQLLSHSDQRGQRPAGRGLGILCRDNEVTRWLDAKRILCAARQHRGELCAALALASGLRESL